MDEGGMGMYYVIGGQYEAYNYGSANTLIGAKRIASSNEEYWDNWGGWHKPAVYAAEDCEKKKNFYGEQMIPKLGAVPVSVWENGKWVNA